MLPRTMLRPIVALILMAAWYQSLLYLLANTICVCRRAHPTPSIWDSVTYKPADSSRLQTVLVRGTLIGIQVGAAYMTITRLCM